MCLSPRRRPPHRPKRQRPWHPPGPFRFHPPRNALPISSIGGQKIQVGLAHAGKTAEVTVEADTYQITLKPGIIIITAPRTTSRDIRRHKASNYSPEVPPGVT
jgi:hypothetical protein